MYSRDPQLCGQQHASWHVEGLSKGLVHGYIAWEICGCFGLLTAVHGEEAWGGGVGCLWVANKKVKMIAPSIQQRDW